MADLPNLTGHNIQDTYQRLLQVGDGGIVYDGTGSVVPTLQMTASHAITEVNYETSSSYAETASYAYDFTLGNDINAANLSEIKVSGIGVVAFQASQLLCMEDVKLQDNNKLLLGNSDATNPYENDMEMWHDGSNTNFVNNHGLLNISSSNGLLFKSSITCSGNIHSSVGDITTVGDIKSTGSLTVGSGEVYGSGSEVGINVGGYLWASGSNGHITASGNISSSGDVYADAYYSEGQAVINYVPGQDRIQIGNKPTYIQGNITASGDISSSGDLYGSNIYTSTSYRLDDSGGTSRHIIRSQNNEIELGNSNFTDGILLTGNITASGNISASGKLYATDVIGDVWKIEHNANHLLISSSGTEQVATYIQGKSTIITPSALVEDPGEDYYSNLHVVGDLTTTSHITASGNISSSGKGTFERTSVDASYDFKDGTNNIEGISYQAGMLQLSQNTNIAGLLTVEVVSVTGHISSSADISASGELAGMHIKAHGEYLNGGGNTHINYTGSNDALLGNSYYSFAHTGKATWRTYDYDGGSHTYSNKFFISGSGDVGIGITTPVARLDVNGDIQTNSHITASGNISSSGYIYAGGDIHAVGDVVASSTTPSDYRLKENIKPIDSPLEKVLNLDGKEFDWIHTGESDFGLIAQDVEKIIPRIVKEKNILGEEETKKVVNYISIIPLLVESIKELNNKIEELNRE